MIRAAVHLMDAFQVWAANLEKLNKNIWNFYISYKKIKNNSYKYKSYIINNEI
jgi:hypothetical protein